MIPKDTRLGRGMRLGKVLGLYLVMVLFFLTSGCVSSLVAQAEGTSLAAVQDRDAHPVVGAVYQAAPYRETDFVGAMPLTLPELHVDADDDYDAGAAPFSFDEVDPVPSISEIVLDQYEDWRGVRYRSGGSDYRGIDCSGLVQAIFKEAFQVELPRSSVQQIKMGEAVARDEIQPGDLVYFVDRGRSHVGVAVNKKEFVHASRKKGVVMSSLDKYWAPRLLRVRRIL